jgi:hypothetical protein
VCLGDRFEPDIGIYLDDKQCICKLGYYMNPDGTCKLTCPDSTYPNSTSRSCDNCPTKCFTCISFTQCTNCSLGFFFNNVDDCLCANNFFDDDTQ